MATKRTQHQQSHWDSSQQGSSQEDSPSLVDGFEARIAGATTHDASCESDLFLSLKKAPLDPSLASFIEETSLVQLVYWKLQKFVDDLSLTDESSLKLINLLDYVTRHVERSLFSLVLKKTQGNLSLAAKVLGCNRNTLHRKLKEFRLSPLEFRKRLREHEARQFVESLVDR